MKPKRGNSHETLGFKNSAIILGFALVGWALCGVTMFVGMELVSMQSALIAHSVAAPIIFAVLSWIDFTRFGYTSPRTTAIVFLLFVITFDFFVVALGINRSFDMFLSWLGTWFPFALLFTSTYLTGLLAGKCTVREVGSGTCAGSANAPCR